MKKQWSLFMSHLIKGILRILNLYCPVESSQLHVELVCDADELFWQGLGNVLVPDELSQPSKLETGQRFDVLVNLVVAVVDESEDLDRIV